jgi:oligopeptide/dipeptide ABC transporter ATP-binding protein
MYLGRIVEIAETHQVFESPRHPYTRVLLSAAPRLVTGQDLDAVPIRGEPPSPTAVPSGCAFRTRCAHAEARCAEAVPALEAAGEVVRGDASGYVRDASRVTWAVACHRWREIEAAAAAARR